jgi:hypothetical protein
MILLPNIVVAATECSVKEYPGHYYVYCLGDEISGPALLHSPLQTAPPGNSATVGKVTAPVPQAIQAVIHPVTTKTVSARQPETNSPDKAINLTASKPNSDVMPSMYRPPRTILRKYPDSNLATTSTTEK